MLYPLTEVIGRALLQKRCFPCPSDTHDHVWMSEYRPPCGPASFVVGIDYSFVSRKLNSRKRLTRWVEATRWLQRTGGEARHRSESGWPSGGFQRGKLVRIRVPAITSVERRTKRPDIRIRVLGIDWLWRRSCNAPNTVEPAPKERKFLSEYANPAASLGQSLPRLGRSPIP